MEFWWEMGLPMMQAMQSVGWLEWPMQAITWLGSEGFFLLFIALLYWCIDMRLGVQVALILLLSTSLNSVLKLIFASPRPYWYSTWLIVHGAESSFGMPSAHAQNAVAVWGQVAGQTHSWWVSSLAVMLMLLIGLSRIYLGVHFPTDVLIGWGVGIGVLWLFKQLTVPIGQWIRWYGLGSQLGIAAITSFLLMLPSFLAAGLRSAWQLPAAWMQTLSVHATPMPQPLSLDVPVAAAGTWLGFVTGVLWLNSRQSFYPRGNLWQRGLQYGVGMSVAIALWVGLDRLLPDGTTTIAYGGRYLRYILLGTWIAAGAPRVFLWMRRSL